MALDSLIRWQWLSDLSGLPIFHPHRRGVLLPEREPFLDQSMEVHRRLGLPTRGARRAALQARFPQIELEGIEVALLEPDFGVLMARRAVQTLVASSSARGGDYRRGAVKPPACGAALDAIGTERRRDGSAGHSCSPAGPGCRSCSPTCSVRRIFPTRQEVFFFAPPAGDTRFERRRAARLGRLQRWRHLLRHARSGRPRIQDCA